jgi:hypothetical protein
MELAVLRIAGAGVRRPAYAAGQPEPTILRRRVTIQARARWVARRAVEGHTSLSAKRLIQHHALAQAAKRRALFSRFVGLLQRGLEATNKIHQCHINNTANLS